MKSLYDCYNARCQSPEIVCAKNHKLNKGFDGTMPFKFLQRGKPLICEVCQNCEDFSQMDGGDVLPQDRGWVV